MGLIREQIADGLVYVGESAGAIIAAKDIDYSKLMDDPVLADSLTDTAGLAEVEFAVLPHYEEEPFVESGRAILAAYKDQLHLL